MGYKLSAKQKAFIENYTIGDTLNNATQSAIKAGYAYNTANNADSLILGKIGVKVKIAAINAKTTKKYEHSREVSLQNLEEIIVLAKAQGNTASMVAAEREKNAITGLHVQTILQDNDQQRKLDEKEKHEATRRQ